MQGSKQNTTLYYLKYLTKYSAYTMHTTFETVYKQTHLIT